VSVALVQEDVNKTIADTISLKMNKEQEHRTEIVSKLNFGGSDDRISKRCLDLGKILLYNPVQPFNVINFN